MQKYICEMMSARVQAEQLAIDHVRNSGERMPIARMSMRERPSQAMKSQPVRYGWVCVNVGRVIVINEIVAKRRTENEPGRRCQENANARKDPGRCSIVGVAEDGRHFSKVD